MPGERRVSLRAPTRRIVRGRHPRHTHCAQASARPKVWRFRAMLKKVAAIFWSGTVLFVAPAAHAQTAPPPPWQSTDIGAVETPGEVHLRGAGFPNEWFVSGAGSDIWGTADSFFYVYQPLRDGSISTTVFAETGTHPFAKAGVMIRQTLDPSSPEVIVDVKPNGGIEFMTRM